MVKILLVEDDPSIRTSIALFLKKLNHAVVECADGEEAMALACDPYTDVQLILLDILLPGKDGMEILKEMKSQNIKTPVILLTNLDKTEDMAYARLLGAHKYLIKANTNLKQLDGAIQEVFKV